MIDETIRNSHKIVIKIGSSTLTNEDGFIDKDFIENLALQIETLRSIGKQVVIVSSGARIAGVSTIGKWSRKEDIHYKQALCAIGQVELMDSYRRIFGKHNMHIGQILLTKEDLINSNRTLNIRNTLFTLIDEGVVPIINENDTVCVEEIKIGDNDVLAAHSTVVWGGDLLILFSDIDGIYNKNPNENQDAELIEEIRNIEELENNISMDSKSSFGTGGIPTKIKAAKIVTKYGTPMIVTRGKKKNIITDLAEGKVKATLFLA
ncbi:MAG: glutamate 5-kinase [Tissierellia bacterium]|nr:glutamate 5-kinase [Tissierellia bacterium]MDD4726198.1 glutamate 5-kinase [Tissierellia bacterium]